MIYSFFTYLLESSLCMFVFVVVYKLLISNLTHFTWMRFYLITSVMLSLVLPLLLIPIPWKSSSQSIELLGKLMISLGSPSEVVIGQVPLKSAAGIDWNLLVFLVILAVYVGGVVYKTYHFLRNLRVISQFIKQNPKQKEGNCWIVSVKNEVPAFSFFHYIFINSNYKNLTTNDLKQIRDHEKIHAKQYHTLDVLLVEFVSIAFWFNPFMKYLKTSLQQIHEYLVDEKMAAMGEKKAYTQLLLNLASETKVFSLSASFTGQQIKNRILMITKPRSMPMHKLIFMLLIPLTTMLLLSFSYINTPHPMVNTVKQDDTKLIHKLKIGNITWTGNKAFSNETLNRTLDLTKGDDYNHDISKRLTNGGEVQVLYFDNGYVFYKSDFVENINNDIVDIGITVYEGIKGKIGIVTVVGNTKVSSNEILNKAEIKPGDFFNRTKIVKSVRAINDLGKFVSEKTDIHVIPAQGIMTDDGFAIINLEFVVVEK